MCLAHDLEVDEFAARPEEDRLTAAEKNERINKQLQVCVHLFLYVYRWCRRLFSLIFSFHFMQYIDYSSVFKCMTLLLCRCIASCSFWVGASKLAPFCGQIVRGDRWGSCGIICCLCSGLSFAVSYLLARDNVGSTYGNGLLCLPICLSVGLKLSEIDVWLLLMSNRKLGFPIQNLPSDSWSEVWFHHLWCFWVALSNKLYVVALITITMQTRGKSMTWGNPTGYIWGETSPRT